MRDLLVLLRRLCDVRCDCAVLVLFLFLHVYVGVTTVLVVVGVVHMYEGNVVSSWERSMGSKFDEGVAGGGTLPNWVCAW